MGIFNLGRRQFLKISSAALAFPMLMKKSGSEAKASEGDIKPSGRLKNPKTEEYTGDIVIVGGGGGGLIAAVAATEQGAKVIMLERRGVLGGNAVNAGGPPSRGSIQEKGIAANAIPDQKSVVTKAGQDEFFRKAMDWSHCRSDGRLLRTLIKKSGDTIRWLGEKGMQFNDYKYPSQEEPPFAFGFGPGNSGVVFVNTLIKLCEDLGVQILLNTRAKKLLTDRDGRVTGVLAEGKDGEVRLNAKGVIMSTGGFLGNKDLMKRYFHSYTDDFYKDVQFGGAAHNGDGLLMAMDIGAADTGTIAFEWNGNRFPWLPMHLPESCSAIVEIMDNTLHPSPIWVNRKGERFTDESNGQSTNSLYTQPHKVCYTLFDESIKQGILSQPPRTESDTPFPVRLERELKEQAEKGRVKKADSWDEIAKFIGAKPEVLKASIDEYNSGCDRGYDDIFLKDSEHLVPLRTPPFYAIESRLNMLLTRGPLKVNQHMEVLDKEYNPIPGLYAAGVDIGGTDTDTYCSMLVAHSTGFTISSGRIAAENAVKYISRK